MMRGIYTMSNIEFDISIEEKKTTALGHVELDDIDKKILKILSVTALMPHREIAEQIGVKSPTTISNRIKKLEDEGIIKGYKADIDSAKLGFDWTVVIEIVVSKGELVKTEQEIAKLSECLAVYDSTGNTDIIVIAKFRNRADLSIFTKILFAMTIVERTITHIVLNTWNEEFF